MISEVSEKIFFGGPIHPKKNKQKTNRRFAPIRIYQKNWMDRAKKTLIVSILDRYVAYCSESIYVHNISRDLAPSFMEIENLSNHSNSSVLYMEIGCK